MVGFSVYSLLEDSVSNQKTPQQISEIVVKIPVSLPYVTDWHDDESFDKELLHGDDFYHVISRKIANDTLYLQCEFNESARDRFWSLISVFDEHVKASNDFGKNHPGGLIMKNLLKEYMSTDRRLTFFILEWIIPQEIYHPANTTLLPGVERISTPPPNFI